MLKTSRTALLAASLLAPAAALHAKPGWKDLQKGINQARELRDELSLGRENEDRLGREVSAYLLARHGLLQDEARTRYVTLVGRTLARKVEGAGGADLPYRFGILDTDAVNAYAAPGGRIFVTAGLLDKLSNEAQLAGVLAHEIVHVADKHAIKGFVKAKALSVLGDKIAEKSKFDSVVRELIEGITEKGLPKADEFKADRGAVALMQAAGYNPFGLAAALDRLYGKKEEALTRSFHSRHPPLAARLKRLDKRLEDVSPEEGRILGRRYRGRLR